MKVFMFLSVIAVFSGCTSTETQPDERTGPLLQGLSARGMDCISIRTIRDYTPLDESNLIIWAASRPYLVRIFSRTSELRASFQLTYSSRDDQLCPYGGDELSFGFGGPGMDSYHIDSIQRLSKQQAQELQDLFSKDPKKQEAPEPKEVEGAEVEELG